MDGRLVGVATRLEKLILSILGTSCVGWQLWSVWPNPLMDVTGRMNGAPARVQVLSGLSSNIMRRIEWAHSGVCMTGGETAGSGCLHREGFCDGDGVE